MAERCSHGRDVWWANSNGEEVVPLEHYLTQISAKPTRLQEYPHFVHPHVQESNSHPQMQYAPLWIFLLAISTARNIMYRGHVMYHHVMYREVLIIRILR